jgi:FkbM family methyltransferase
MDEFKGKMIEWRGKHFKAAEGSLHPAYSLHTFDEERAFREEHWKTKEGDIVFDIGASYGAYALSACSDGATMVHAFEPEPSVWADLMLNIEINDWNSRCVATCAGLWSRVGEIDMHEYAPHWPQHTITGKYKSDTLDNVVVARGVTKMDWLKIDVEGAEMEVLVGGRETLRRLRPEIIVEVHTFLDETLLSKVSGYLADLGYGLKEVPREPCVMVVGSPR